jgi:uncharacterized protein (TIRG00374 family)
MKSISKPSTFIPAILGIAILVIIFLIAPWRQIGELLEKVPLPAFLALLALSATYYLSKAIRFWYILRLLDIKKPLIPVSLLYLSGQLYSLLPAGELYRTVLLKKHLGVSMSKSSPSVTIQGLIEAIVLISISIVGAFLIGKNRLIVAVVGVLLVAVIIALQRGWLTKMHPLLDKIPYLSINKHKYNKFIKGHQQLLSPRALTSLVIFSLLPVLSGISILYISSKAIGFDISFIESAISYSLPSIVAGLSFLPGGVGVSEGGTIGMLHLFGATAAASVTITLLLRLFTLASGLLYSVIAQGLWHLKKDSL